MWPRQRRQKSVPSFHPRSTLAAGQTQLIEQTRDKRPTLALEADVVILGGGPAGVVLARCLLALGHVVVVLGERRPPAWEGVSPRVVEGLRRAGCQAATSVCQTWVRRVATWNGETTAPNQECLVERISLDEALWRDAAQAGARLHRAWVEHVEREPDAWLVRARGERAIEARAAFLVEARGRRAPRSAAPRARGPRSVALARLFREPAHSGPASGVAAFADGWAWFAAFPNGRRVVQILRSAEPGELPGRAALPTVYAAGLRALAPAREWIRGASAESGVLAREATSVLHADLAGPNWLRVGDAAFAIDPLSGHGIYEAVGGALAAAATVNTLLRRPVDGALARDFYAGRAAELFAHQCQVGRSFYAREERWSERPFWAARRRWPDDAALDAVPGPERHVARRPVVEDGWIVEREVVVTPRYPRGVLLVDEVPVALLLHMLHEQDGRMPQAEDLARRLATTERQVSAALDWLRANQ